MKSALADNHVTKQKSSTRTKGYAEFSLTALSFSQWNVNSFVINGHAYVKLCDNLMVYLQAKHATPGNTTWGIDGETGNIVDMKEFNIWEPFSVKAQVYKTAVEVCTRFHSNGPL